LRAAFPDETGTGAAYFQGGDIGTPSAGNGSNLTALNASQLTTGTLPPARLGLGQLTNSLGADVALNNTANYFDGPSVAQGSTGTWFGTGTMTLTDSGGAQNFYCKLWDGTTVMASGNAVSGRRQRPADDFTLWLFGEPRRKSADILQVRGRNYGHDGI
jgi:hypothetical protein